MLLKGISARCDWLFWRMFHRSEEVDCPMQEGKGLVPASGNHILVFLKPLSPEFSESRTFHHNEIQWEFGRSLAGASLHQWTTQK